eukprot:1160994-Rhodomonas_salina.1
MAAREEEAAAKHQDPSPPPSPPRLPHLPPLFLFHLSPRAPAAALPSPAQPPRSLARVRSPSACFRSDPPRPRRLADL